MVAGAPADRLAAEGAAYFPSSGLLRCSCPTPTFPLACCRPARRPAPPAPVGIHAAHFAPACRPYGARVRCSLAFNSCTCCQPAPSCRPLPRAPHGTSGSGWDSSHPALALPPSLLSPQMRQTRSRQPTLSTQWIRPPPFGPPNTFPLVGRSCYAVLRCGMDVSFSHD